MLTTGIFWELTVHLCCPYKSDGYKKGKRSQMEMVIDLAASILFCTLKATKNGEQKVGVMY